MAPNLYMLVPHDPALDPRIHYTATSLSKIYDVTVLAVINPSTTRPEVGSSSPSRYHTVRLAYTPGGTFQMLHDFAGLWLSRWITQPRLRHALSLMLSSGVFLAGAIPRLLARLLSNAARAAIRVACFPLQFARGIRTGGKTAVSPNGDDQAEQVPPATRFDQSLSVLPGVATLNRISVTIGNFLQVFRLNAHFVRYFAGRNFHVDAVYCHDLHSLQTGAMLRTQGTKWLIYDSHEYYPYLFPWWLYVKLAKWYESVLVRHVDTYITISRQLADELEEQYAFRPIHVLPNLDLYARLDTDRPVTEMTELAAGRLRILFQGNFNEGRGLDEVLREWRSVDGRRAALFLRGPRNGMRDGIERLAKELGLLGTSVYILPPVLEKDLIEAAREADIGLIPYKADSPSYRFACPNKLSQYIHAGVAVLSNNIPYVAGILAQGKVGLCYDIRKTGSFSQAVDLLVHDAPLVQQFKTNALAFSESTYNWGNYEELLLKIAKVA